MHDARVLELILISGIYRIPTPEVHIEAKLGTDRLLEPEVISVLSLRGHEQQTATELARLLNHGRRQSRRSCR